MREGVLLLFFFLPGCASSVPPVPAEVLKREGEAGARAESLRETVQAILDGGWNPGRFSAVRRRSGEMGLGPNARAEWIDWFSLERNLVIELAGPDPGIVYVVAHYDKTDLNPLKFVSLLVNGLLDEAISWSYFSDGAVDNATGVAVALELARALRTDGHRRTYRILITGSEESGLRGARAHAARLSAAEWERIAFVINVDSVGVDFSPTAVIANASDPRLVDEALQAAERVKVPLKIGAMPAGADGDHTPFAKTGLFRDLLRGLMMNLVGGLLPQRSWFTGRHSAPVLVFAADPLLDAGDYLGGLVLLPMGQIHGPRDTASHVDPARLHDLFRVLEELLRKTDLAHAGVPEAARVP